MNLKRTICAALTIIATGWIAGFSQASSGIIPANPELRGDLKGQTRTVLQTITSLLKQAGMDFSNLVEAEVFITDTRNLKTVNEVYNELVKSPATPTNIGLDLMSADLLVEIAVLAQK